MSAMRSTLLSAAIAAAFALTAPTASAANAISFKPWGDGAGSAPSLAIDQTLSVTKSGVGSNNYSDNPTLNNAAWAHSGGSPWYTFFLTAAADVNISLTPTAGAETLFNPGMTVWASGSTKFDGGTGNFDDVGENGWNSPHSFNMIGQIGAPGTLWSTGEYGNQLETLAYAITNTDLNGAGNGWGGTIVAGVVKDVSASSSFENGVSGSAIGNSIYMNFSGMQSGWYTVFIGGTNSDYTATSYDLSVSAVAAVPEPGTWAMMIAGLGVLGALARRRQG